ncbi:MAG: hypothetical protein FJZ58_02265 [Chlamydiae bacterium]|nr:hypothetical protein [Chlamydiota bacterium]
MSATQSSTFSQASSALERCDFSRAKALFFQLMQQGDPKAHLGYKRASDQLARRYWRQGKTAEMIQEIENPSMITLAVARMQGVQALASFPSQHPDHLLARCFLEPSLRSALLMMRQDTSYREIAEGWLALLKKDFQRAREAFVRAQEKQPRRAKLGLLLLDYCQGIKVQDRKDLSPFFKIALSRFPNFSQMIGRQKAENGVTCPTSYAESSFYRGSYKELEVVEKKLSKEENSLRAKLFLRMGDLEYAEGRESSAKKHWDKASRLSCDIELDLCKRRWLSADSPAEDQTSFTRYVEILHQQDPKLVARFFLDLLLYHPVHELRCLKLPPTLLDRWAENLTEKQSILFYAPFFSCLAQMLAKVEEDFEGTVPLEVLSIYQIIPASSSLHTLYEKVRDLEVEEDKLSQLQKKLFHLLGDLPRKRKLIVKELLSHPQEVHQLLPEYTQCILVDRSIKPRDITAEIKKLSSLFPGHFDLARLISKYVTQEALECYLAHSFFSSQLTRILFLQNALDDKHKKLSEQLLTELIENYHTLREEEALWRLWHAVATTSWELPSSLIHNLFQKIQCAKDLRPIFTKITRYTESKFSPSFLFIWQKRFPDDAYAAAFLSLVHLCETNKRKRNRIFKELEDHPPYTTKGCYDGWSADCSVVASLHNRYGTLTDYILNNNDT